MTDDLMTFANALVGAIVPWLVNAIRQRWLPWSGRAAMWMSLLVSALCVTVSYFATDSTPALREYLANLAMAFTLSQVVYYQVADRLQPPPAAPPP